jgi:hypothetical protein
MAEGRVRAGVTMNTTLSINFLVYKCMIRRFTERIKMIINVILAGLLLIGFSLHVNIME